MTQGKKVARITFAILSTPLVCRGQSVISTVAGTGTCCADADGVAATLAYLQGADGSLGGPNLPAGFAMGSIASPIGPVYSNSPAAGTLTGGAYTLTGLGGAQVGSFSASTTFPASFTVTNWDSVTAIDRTRPLTFNWTGAGFDRVFILANSATTAGSNQRLVTISCYVPGSEGSSSVPVAALAY